MNNREVDPITETLVMGFLELIHERYLAGKTELAATMVTIAEWLTARTGLSVSSRHIPILVKTLAEAGIISVGGAGIGKPNYYTTREKEMGSEAFWNQVDALLMIWKHPARKRLRR